MNLSCLDVSCVNIKYLSQLKLSTVQRRRVYDHVFQHTSIGNRLQQILQQYLAALQISKY